MVTGGAWFIGNPLCDALLAKNANKVVCLDDFFLGKMENISDAILDERFRLYHDNARHYGFVEAIIGREKIDVVLI